MNVVYFPSVFSAISSPDCFTEKISGDVKLQILRHEGEFCLPAVMAEKECEITSFTFFLRLPLKEGGA